MGCYNPHPTSPKGRGVKNSFTSATLTARSSQVDFGLIYAILYPDQLSCGHDQFDTPMTRERSKRQ